ncbi:MAG: RHS repeat-associated core domain-containing protein [Pseudomonadota bacterium]
MAGGVQSLQLHARYFSYLTADDVLIASDGAGKRRFPTGADDVGGALTSSVMSRGFTGHEMLDDTDLVQMNGRIYDPSLGKFLSADPFIQDKYLAASLNRYSYVWNNPLSYTDPSGHFVEWLVLAAVAYGVGEAVPELKPFTNIIVAASLHIAGQGWVTSLNLSGNALIAAQATTAGVTGGLSSSAASNSFSSFGLGFAQGVATFGIGHKFGDVLSGGWQGEVGRALSHGTVGGLVSEAVGETFSSGFLAAGFSSVAGIKEFKDFWPDVVYNAVAGGIGAELGGGKFADGAKTGAFVYLYNHMMQRQRRRTVRCSNWYGDECSFDAAGRSVELEVEGAGWPISGFSVTGQVYDLDENGQLIPSICGRRGPCGNFNPQNGHVTNKVRRTIRAPRGISCRNGCRWFFYFRETTVSDNQQPVTMTVTGKAL